MKKLTIYEVKEGNSKNLVDINIGSTWVKDVPYFGEFGNVISYDEALNFYGADALGQDIWDDENYIKYIDNWKKANK